MIVAEGPQSLIPDVNQGILQWGRNMIVAEGVRGGWVRRS